MNSGKKVLLDFTSVEVETHIDEFETIDISKLVGNSLRMGTNDIGLDDMCREIYHNGKTEVPVEWLTVLKQLTVSPQVPMVISAKQAVLKVIEAAEKSINS